MYVGPVIFRDRGKVAELPTWNGIRDIFVMSVLHGF